ncbi:MAG: lipopolysaccharide biosynthesis protein [Clostridia bacterium]|nr:lipopolysaccharide biosynthesis protein [Clostridia bacterium]
MINLLFCGNDKVFDGMLTCALSALMRSDTEEPFTFYVYTMDVSHIKKEYVPVGDRQIAFLDETVKRYNPENRVVKIDVTDIYRAEFAGCPNESAYCSPYTLIRLFADLVPEMPDKLLYLDADILFNRDITLLYGIDIEGYEYAAARDHYGKYLLYPNYINAGVLLFNLKKIRETGLLEKARCQIRAKKLMFADQSAIVRSTAKKKMLPQRFNDQKFLHKHTVVRHFSKRLFWLPYPHTENIKQWQVDKVRKIFGYDCFDDILDEYVSLKEKFNKEENANG